MRLILPPIITVACIVGGCAQRTLKVTSDPPGALVSMNDLEVGRTPLDINFIDYGTYDVVLRKEGYQTMKLAQPLSMPWYMVPPLDLFSELFGARDRQEWHFTMTAASTRPADPQQLLARAREMQAELESSQYTKAVTRRTTKPSTTRATRPATTRRGR